MKQLIHNITTSISLPRALARRLVLLLAALLVGVGQAWGLRYAKAEAQSSPSEGGLVYVSKSNGTPFYSNSSDESTDYNGKLGTQTFTFYYSAQANSPYVFRGWANSANTNSVVSTTRERWSQQVSADWHNDVVWNPATITRYALFACMTANVSSWNAGNVNVESSATKTITISHAHADKISAKLTGSTDFSINTTTIVNSSVAAGTGTITVTFRPTSAGNKNATLEISSAYGGLSKITISLSGTGVLNANTLSVSAGKTTMLVDDNTSLTISNNSDGAISYSLINNNAYSSGLYDSNYGVISQSGTAITARNAGTATLRITQAATYKYAGKTIDISFTVNKHDQSISWADCIDDDYLLVNETRTHVATASSGLAVSYSSSNAGVLSVSSGGQMKGESVGNDITITASQAGNYKYKPAESLSCIYDVRAKLVPVFTPNPSPDQEPSTYNIKVDDAIVFSLTNVSSIASGNFTFSATKDNGNDVVSCSRVDDVLTVRAIHEGTTTLTLNQAETFSAPYISALSATYTINVTKYNNTLVATLSDNELLVDETATISFTKQNNVNTAIDVTISNEMLTNAALSREINGVKPVITYSNGVITAQNAGTARITFSQPATVKYTASTVYGFDITVNKIGNNLSTSVSATSILVDGTSSASFTGQNNAGTINVNISNESLTNAALSREINGVKPVITYSNGIITGQNAGTARITFSQPETYKYSGYSHYFDITVTKRTNTIKVNNATPYTVGLNLASSQAVTITSDNNLSSPMVSASSNAAVATYSGTGAGGTITTYYTAGSASWTVTQDEDYKYQAGSATITANVSALTPTPGNNCYLEEFDCNEHEVYHYNFFGDHDNRYEVTWNNPLNNVSTISFSAKRQTAGTGNLAIYQQVNGSWQYVDEIGSSLTDGYKVFSRQVSPSCTGVQFRDASGTLAKYVKCVKVNKLPYMEVSPTSLNFGTTRQNVAVAPLTFDIEWSGNNTGDIHIVSSDPTHFTVDKSLIDHSDCGNATITVTYHPVDIDTHNGTITIYDKGRVKTVPVIGITQPKYDLVINAPAKTIYVDDNVVSGFSFSYAGNNVQVPAPGAGSGSSHFYFEIANTVNSNIIGCDPEHREDVVTYDPVNNTLRAWNAGTAVITFHEEGSTEVNARSSQSVEITVKKRDNTLKTPFETENSWSAIMNYGTGRYVRIESDNTDVANCPIVVTPLTGQNYATYYDDQKAIYVVGPEGTQTATWAVSQVENYKYKAAETKTMTVTIQAAAEGPCYVLNESDEKWFINLIELSGHFGDEDVYEVSGPTNELSFDARIGTGGINESFGTRYFVVQYSVDGGNAWTEIARPDISTSYQHFSYDLSGIEGITHIRFGAYEGGTGVKYYKNVKITRKTYLNANDIEIITKADGTPIYPSEDGHAVLTIDYSLASGGTLHISNDNPSVFVLSDAEVTNVDCATNLAEVQITYHARTGVEGTDGTAEDVAHISIYNTTYSKSVTLTGVTTKRNQIGQWKEHIETLMVGTVVEDAYWATLSQQNGVTYTIVEGDAIEINSDNNLVAVKEGDVTIQAHVDGDGIYNSITSELFPIYVTSKYTQYIDWNQNLLHLTIGDANVVLTATAMSDIDGCTTNGSRPIVYYIKDGSDNVVKVVNGNELQVIGVGTVSVIATQTGGVDGDGHEYAPTSVEKKAVVRDPSAPCEAYIYEQGEERRFDMGAVPFWKQNASQEIDFGGQEPESYTFEYKGEYKNRVMFDGTMSVEQYVNGAWSLVENLGKPEISTYKTASHTLDRNATKMRVSIHDAQGYHYFKDCQVKLVRYMEVLENGVQMSPQTLTFNVLVTSSQSRSISIKYSNISGPLSFVLPEGAPFILDKSSLEGSCGDRGTIDLTITYVPTVIETDEIYTLTITDGVLTQEVELKATANLLECIYPETAPNKDWHADDNWSTGAVPNSSCRAILEHDVVITGSAYVYGITMDEGVHLTIAPTGALTVGAGGIVGEGLLSENIVLEAGADGKTGALRIHPKAEAPNATVQFYSTVANPDSVDDWKWQYIGTPVSNPDMNERIFYNCWLYKHDAATNTWDNAGNWNHMQPFLGYAFTRNDGKPNSYSRPSTGPLFAFMGKLNAPEKKSLTLTVGTEGQNENHLANSWTAPIHVSKFTEDDLSGIDKKTIYYYPIDYRGNVEGLPPFSAKYTGSDVIPAMQGFFVLANENGAKLVLNYEKLIWDVNAINNEPLKAPSREREEQDELLSRVCINLLSADSIPDHIYLLEKEGEGFSRDFTEGYDAPKYFVDGLPCIYTYETSGPHLAVSATDDVVGTYLAINTGASQDYTLTFSKVIGEGLGLRDLVTNTIVPITEGMQYAFTAPANSSPMLRFVVVEHEETPEWNNNNGTSLEDVGGEFKIWQSGEILSVIGAGSHASLRLYDAAGKLILSEFFNEATAINLNALPTGVYMVQVNDKTEKVLR